MTTTTEALSQRVKSYDAYVESMTRAHNTINLLYQATTAAGEAWSAYEATGPSTETRQADGLAVGVKSADLVAASVPKLKQVLEAVAASMVNPDSPETPVTLQDLLARIEAGE